MTTTSHSSAAAILAEAGIAAAQEAEDLLQAIQRYEFGRPRTDLSRAEEWVRASLDSPSASGSVAAALATLLESDATYDCKDFVCRQLVYCGTGAQVPVLAKLLRDPETSDIARYALHAIPGDAADGALLEALDETEGLARIGIINTLGERGVTSAAKALKKLSKSDDADTSAAAMAALAKL